MSAGRHTIARYMQVDISKDNRALQKLRRETERAKRALSSQHQVRPVLRAAQCAGRCSAVNSGQAVVLTVAVPAACTPDARAMVVPWL